MYRIPRAAIKGPSRGVARIVPLQMQSALPSVRYNSSNPPNSAGGSLPPSSKPATRRTFNPDWSSRTVAYEEIKKRARAPVEVSF